MKRLAVLLGCVLVGCQPKSEPVEQPPVALGIDYSGWPAVTPKSHRIPAALAMDCAAPTPNKTVVGAAERKSRGPHAGAAIEVRVSPDALDRFRAGQPVPVGTAVIKLKYPDDEASEWPAAVGAMIKREAGYDPDGGDWEYYYSRRWPPAERETVRGKLETCAECRRRAKATDFLFRPYLDPAKAGQQ